MCKFDVNNKCRDGWSLYTLNAVNRRVAVLMQRGVSLRGDFNRPSVSTSKVNYIDIEAALIAALIPRVITDAADKARSVHGIPLNRFH